MMVMTMKVGDLIKDKMSEQVGIIVATKMVNNGSAPAGELEPYHRCLVGKDYIWFFEISLEVINENR